MSTALAIAGVSAVLRDLLNDGLVNNNASGALGTSVTVSLLAPDRVLAAGNETSQLNLFLYAVTPNPGWRNEGLPSRDAGGRQRLSNAPLALDLHYLLSAYSGADLHAEILLGYAMQLLHEQPVLTRAAIRTALNPAPGVGTVLPPALRALSESGLADQLELVKLTPNYLNNEETSKLWSATQSHMRPSMAYTASVVLIEARQPTRTALPVLTRGPRDPATGRDAGVVVQTGLQPRVPVLTHVQPPARQPVAAIGDTVLLHGSQLDGDNREVVLRDHRFDIVQLLPVQPPTAERPAERTAVFSLAGLEAALPAGHYRVALRVTRPDVFGQVRRLEAQSLPLTLAPAITNLPQTVTRDAEGAATVVLQFTPELRAGQRASMVLGTQEITPEADGATPTQQTFRIADAQPGDYLVRLRVDGLDSPIVDLDVEPPALPGFLDRTLRIQ